MKKLVCLVAFLAMSGMAMAQNSAIAKAEALMEKNNYAEAERVLNEALANPKTTKFQEMYNKAANVQIRVLNPELVSAANGMPFDTLKFCNAVDKAINFFTKSHEAGVTPDAKGRVKQNPLIEADTHLRMLQMADYYNYAAVFLYEQQKMKESQVYFQKYIDMAKSPVFSKEEQDSLLTKNGEAYSQAKSNLARLSYSMKDWPGTIRYADQALEDTMGIRDLFIMKQQACLEMGDTAAWLKTLVEATNRTEDGSFAQNLLYYYVQKNEVAEAEKVAADMVAAGPGNKMAWYMKGCVEMDLKKDYKAARESFLKALEIDPDFSDGNFNMGVVTINQLVERTNNNEFKLTNKGSYTMKEKAQFMAENKEILKSYEEAKKYFEKVRELQPDKPKAWVYRLSQVYNNMTRVYKNLQDNAKVAEYQQLTKEMEAIEDSLRQNN